MDIKHAVASRNQIPGDRSPLDWNNRQKLVPFVFLLPSLALFITVILYPICYVLWLSAQDWNLLKPHLGAQFVWFANYAELLKSKDFWSSILITLKFTFWSVLIEMLLGFALALFLNREYYCKKLVQTVLLAPIMMSQVASGITLKFILAPDFGYLNYFLKFFKIPGPNWLGDVRFALPSVIAIDVWLQTSFVFLVLYAGLQALPSEPEEAAAVDGASKWQIIRYVIIPLLKPVWLVILIIRIMDALRAFNTIYVMTQGGPGNSTKTIQMLDYQLSFTYFKVGSGASLAIIIVFLILAFGGILIKQLNTNQGND